MPGGKISVVAAGLPAASGPIRRIYPEFGYTRASSMPEPTLLVTDVYGPYGCTTKLKGLAWAVDSSSVVKDCVSFPYNNVGR
jgi:hypothetical protein